ncbi:MAG: DUF4303 domain-containing protein [Propioniciclava sp.]
MVVLVRGVLPARGLIGLHRVLGVGLSEVRGRIDDGHPILDAELFGNDHAEVSRLLDAVLAQVADADFSLYGCNGAEAPAPGNEISPEGLRRLLARRPDAVASAAPGVADPELTKLIADAARKAVTQLRTQTSGPFCVYALLTSGEALRPYLSVTLHGPGRWDLADSPLALVGDEFFAPLGRVYAERGDLRGMAPADADAEYWRRLASMEAALAALDGEGLFGTGTDRAQTLLLVSVMPPDQSDAEFARRLNPPGGLLDAWLAEAAEGA